VAFLCLLVIVAVIGFRLTSGDDRKALLRKSVVVLRELLLVAKEEYERLAPFRETLRGRSRYVIVTPLLLVICAALFVTMTVRGATSDQAALAGWGANFGPKTTNGEWWRLLTASFVQVGFIRMVVELTALAQLGFLLERLAGRPAVIASFCAAGMLAGLVNVSISPMATTAGTSGAIFGLYGLLLAALAFTLRTRRTSTATNAARVEPEPEPDPAPLPDVPLEMREQPAQEPVQDEPVVAPPETPAIVIVPLPALAWLVPPFVLFALSAWLNNAYALKANLAGLAAGIVFGLAVAGDIVRRQPQVRRVLATSGVAVVALVACAIPVRGIADVRPDIANIIALEDRTAGTYDAALQRANKGKMTPDAMAQLIERSIVPELEAADAHLLAIRGVPPEHQPLVVNADQYLKLRSASWKLYAETWRNKVKSPRQEADGVLTSDASWHQVKAKFRADAATRGKAEGTERASLAVLEQLKKSSSPAPTVS
jgi:membrane associated rhomboid family serine protease